MKSVTFSELETTRLLLRQWRQEDFESYADFFADEEMARYVGGKQDRPRAWRTMAAVAGHWLLRGFGFWAVEEKKTGKFAGAVGLWFPEGWPELELGYWLKRDMQGKGYATEAALKSREYAYDALQAPPLASYIHPDNEASKRVAKRLGATLEKTIELLDHGPHCVYRHPKE